MKQIVISLLFFVLLISETAYSLPNACESIMGNLFQRFHSFQTERRLKTAENRWKGAKILKRMLKNNPDLSLKVRIAKIAGTVYPKEGLDVLRQLLFTQDDPPLELQEAIIRSILFNHYYPSAFLWKSTREKMLHFLEEWLENIALPPEIQSLFIHTAKRIRKREGFDLLKKISDKYPSLDVEREFAYIVADTGGLKGFEMLKERLTIKELSPAEQEIYAFYAGQMEDSYSLDALKLLEEQPASSLEQLRFSFSAGQKSLNSSRDGGGSSSSSDSSSAVMVF